MTDEQIDLMHRVLNSLLARDVETRAAVEALRERVARMIATEENREFTEVLDQLRHDAAVLHEKALLEIEKIDPGSAAQIDLRPKSPSDETD